MEFPKVDFEDEEACFKALLDLVHPEGLRCPDCRQRDGVRVHDNNSQPWHIRYWCRHCDKTFHIWTGTKLEGTHFTPSEILRLMKGMVEGQSTRHIAKSLGRDRDSVAHWRHQLQKWVHDTFGPPPEKSGRGEERQVPENVTLSQSACCGTVS